MKRVRSSVALLQTGRGVASHGSGKLEGGPPLAEPLQPSVIDRLAFRAGSGTDKSHTPICLFDALSNPTG